MKKLLLFLFFIALFQTNIFAQNIGINATGALPNGSAMLDISATNKGMLVPRMTSAQRTTIGTPAIGLLVFDNQTNSFWFYNGAGWTELSVGNNGWGLMGNTGINPATHFIGTTDENPLRFKVNNIWAGEIHPTSFNVFFGINAGVANTTGSSNTAVGEQSLAANTEGNFNVATGYNALSANTTGFNNTAHGAYALFNNTTGRSNTAAGRNALFANATGDYNTAFGEGALLSNREGVTNTAVGYQALFTNEAGTGNTANGYQALYSSNGGLFGTANGYRALYSNVTGRSNTAIGADALYSNTSGEFNTANGASSLSKNTTGGNNTAVGREAMASNTSGNNNTSVGFESLYSNTAGYSNVANGYQALYKNAEGNSNTATGTGALQMSEYGSRNTASGYNALNENTGGNSNTAIGTNALLKNHLGNDNVAIGYYAQAYNIGGVGNIAIGASSGNHPSAPYLSNSIGIGNDDLLNQAPNQVIIGNSSTVAIGGKVGWTTISDARVKNNITEEVKGLDFVLKLRPVTYHISNKAMNAVTGNKETPDFAGKYDGEKIKYSGFLAQEVEQAAKDARYDFSGVNAPKDQKQYYTLTYEAFVVPLVKAVQEQQDMILQMKKEMDEMKQVIGTLKNKN